MENQTIRDGKYNIQCKYTIYEIRIAEPRQELSTPLLDAPFSSAYNDRSVIQ